MQVVSIVGNSIKPKEVSDDDPMITVMSPKYGLTTETMHSIISSYQPNCDPFYVLHLSQVTNLMHEWTHNLPLVKPFYAVKCNPSPCFLSALAALGANFDCASQLEIQAVLSLGVSPDRIVFANPCKPGSHISYAATVGVNVTTYDSVYEVDKIRKFHPTCSLLIRIKAPDEGGARFPLGSKYGALPEEIEPLLLAARAAQLSVIGVSFHVGSDTTNFSTYGKAIAAASSVFQAAARLGMPPMSVLNIGGGFTAGPAFGHAAKAVKDAIRVHFPDHNESGLKVMAEPGRYFAASPFTLVTNVIGKRVRGEVREYWINDGIYGSMDPREYFNITSLKCMPLACVSNRANPTCEGTARFSSTVFGPTCDSADKVLREYELPELEIGDWIVFPNMGAYSAAAAGCDFNGFNGSAISTHLIF